MNNSKIIVIAFFFTSFAHAHPNHMTFEQVSHDSQQLSDNALQAQQLTQHDFLKNQSGHQPANATCMQIKQQQQSCKKKD